MSDAPVAESDFRVVSVGLVAVPDIDMVDPIEEGADDDGADDADAADDGADAITEAAEDGVTDGATGATALLAVEGVAVVEELPAAVVELHPVSAAATRAEPQTARVRI